MSRRLDGGSQESGGTGSAGAGAGTAPGQLFLQEIHEQPASLRSLLESEAHLADVGRLIGDRPWLVRLVAHGSSDNAASFAVYAFGLLAGMTAMRDSISLSVYYGAQLPYRNSAVIALSQSGRTPDVVSYAEHARRGGALTIALTNDEHSPLADACEVVVPLHAGEERGIAATKSYTNELAALALLAGYARGRGPEVAGALRVVADQAD
jgi:glucosamine--fructose-6-phosphate aminotransferase (isomerizing)